jgi:hypothetical protein
MVRLSLRDAQTGDRILPAQYSENYFWLLPGESREVQVSWPDGQPRSGSPALLAEGYNVPCAVPKPCVCLTCWFTLGARADSPRLPVHGPGVRLAGTAGAQRRC